MPPHGAQLLDASCWQQGGITLKWSYYLWPWQGLVRSSAVSCKQAILRNWGSVYLGPEEGIWAMHYIHYTLEASALYSYLFLLINLQMPLSSNPQYRLVHRNIQHFPASSKHADLFPWPLSLLALIPAENPINLSHRFLQEESNPGLCEPQTLDI